MNADQLDLNPHPANDSEQKPAGRRPYARPAIGEIRVNSHTKAGARGIYDAHSGTTPVKAGS